jgi:uncharacterized protein (TIGR03067 family)
VDFPKGAHFRRDRSMTLIRVAGFVLAAVLVAAFATGATADDKEKKFDAAKMVGSYKFVSGVRDGKKVEEKNFKEIALVVGKEDMVLKTADGDFKFGYKIDASKSPVAVDLEILDGPVGKGAKSKGIITLDGDTLKLAYNPMDGDRPKDFDGKGGNFSFTVKKAEAKKKEKDK